MAERWSRAPMGCVSARLGCDRRWSGTPHARRQPGQSFVCRVPGVATARDRHVCRAPRSLLRQSCSRSRGCRHQGVGGQRGIVPTTTVAECRHRRVGRRAHRRSCRTSITPMQPRRWRSWSTRSGSPRSKLSATSTGRSGPRQVSTGDGVVLIGPGIDEFGTRPVTDPAWACSRTFVYVDDVQGHCERARAAGATITHRAGRSWSEPDLHRVRLRRSAVDLRNAAHLTRPLSRNGKREEPVRAVHGRHREHRRRRRPRAQRCQRRRHHSADPVSRLRREQLGHRSGDLAQRLQRSVGRVRVPEHVVRASRRQVSTTTGEVMLPLRRHR